MTKRYGICVFYEKDGIVRDYFLYYINELKKVCEDLLVVVNGKLTEDSRQKLNQAGVEIFQRDNKGLDFGAWKVILENNDKLALYDELVLTNNSCYGPIYPFCEIFEEMDNRKCDFWGITKNNQENNLIAKHNKKKLCEHIQSYFLVFKKNVFLSDAFKIWWNTVKFYNDYKKIVGYYETKFTKYLEYCGFVSDSYVSLENNYEIAGNPTYYTNKLLKEYRLPLVKRKLFTVNYGQYLSRQLPYHAKASLEYIKQNTNYDTDLIWDDLINTQPMSNTMYNLGLMYNLSSNYEQNSIGETKTALVLYISYEENITFCLNYALSMPENSDIYIVTGNKSIIEACKSSSILSGYNVFYILKSNRGGYVSAYLVGAKDVFNKYNLICCTHDQNINKQPVIYSRDTQFQDFESCLKNRAYVKNIINTFNNNKRLGLLCPLPINFGLTNIIGNELGINLGTLKKLINFLKLDIPFDYHPICPFDGMFWVRKEALHPLFRHDWQYEDFPCEPIPSDGTIIQAINSIYPFVAQEAGYYSTYVYPDNFEPVYLASAMYDLSRSKNILFKIFGINPLMSVFFDRHINLSYRKIYLKQMFEKLKYSIMSKITFGNKRKHYQVKLEITKRYMKSLMYHIEADNIKSKWEF